jgi:flagellar biosynthesis/type III secretory pathway chaperone
MITDHHISQAEHLLAILQREHAALVDGDLPAIERLAREKQDAVREMDAVARGLQQLAAAADPERTQQFTTLASECRRQNEINGGMVAASLRHVQQLLAVLQGRTPGDELYSRAGTPAAPGTAGGRPLASA